MPPTPEENQSDKRVTSSHGIRRILDGLIASRSLISVVIGAVSRTRIAIPVPYWPSIQKSTSS
jgi:hypothetical protein